MFSVIYIKKCIKAQDELDFLRIFTMPEEGAGITMLPRFYYKPGDYFHHERTMDEAEFAQVERIERDYLYCEGCRKPYLQDECAWIPTANQLREGLINTHYSLGDTSEMNEEQILDLYMREHERKRWSRQEDNWVSIE